MIHRVAGSRRRVYYAAKSIVNARPGGRCRVDCARASLYARRVHSDIRASDDTALTARHAPGALGLAVVARWTRGPPRGQPRPAGGEAGIVMMASTIGPVDAGIVGALEDAYFKRTGVVVRHAAAGTGAGARDGQGRELRPRDGARPRPRGSLPRRRLRSEHRRDVMYNDFVILGPSDGSRRIRGEPARGRCPPEDRGEPRRGSSPAVTTPAPTCKELELWKQAAGVDAPGRLVRGSRSAGRWAMHRPPGDADDRRGVRADGPRPRTSRSRREIGTPGTGGERDPAAPEQLHRGDPR